MKPLSQLIREAQETLNAITTHEDYAQMQDRDFLVGLDFTQADCLHFLTQLSQAYEDFSLLDDPMPEETGCRIPSFDELFTEQSLDNSLHGEINV
jgi:glutathione S-transferase